MKRSSAPPTIDADATRTAPEVADRHAHGGYAAPASRYEVQGGLGAGGVGIVLAALDLETRRVVALKVPRRELGRDATSGSGERDGTDRFALEARVTAQLEHPAIVPVYDV